MGRETGRVGGLSGLGGRGGRVELDKGYLKWVVFSAFMSLEKPQSAG